MKRADLQRLAAAMTDALLTTVALGVIPVVGPWACDIAGMAALDKRRTCKKCGGSGRYLAYRPTMYETDTEDEREDAIRWAERKCPDCAVDPKAILSAHDSEKDRKIAELAAALDWWNGLVGESQGVYGRHLNGDPSPWSEFEIPSVETAREVLVSHDAEKDRRIAELAAVVSYDGSERK